MIGTRTKNKCFGIPPKSFSPTTFGGIVFDPDSSTYDSLGFYYPNDTTGDEFYTYQWFSSSNLLGANLTPIGDSSNILSNVSQDFIMLLIQMQLDVDT